MSRSILGKPSKNGYSKDLDMEETHETHNLYIESTRGSLKNYQIPLREEYPC